MNTIISSLFDAIARNYNLSVSMNAEFTGIHRAGISLEQATEVIRTCNPRINSNPSIWKGITAFEHPFLVCGEPGAEIIPHVHDRTDAFVYGLLGYANTIVGGHRTILLPLERVDFPKQVVHSLTIGTIGCLFLAFSQKPIVDGGKVTDMRQV